MSESVHYEIEAKATFEEDVWGRICSLSPGDRAEADEEIKYYRQHRSDKGKLQFRLVRVVTTREVLE